MYWWEGLFFSESSYVLCTVGYFLNKVKCVHNLRLHSKNWFQLKSLKWVDYSWIIDIGSEIGMAQGVPRSLRSRDFFHFPIPRGIDSSAPRQIFEDLKKLENYLFFKNSHPFQESIVVASLHPGTFFHFSSFIYNGDNQNMSENLRFYREFLKIV